MLSIRTRFSSRGPDSREIAQGPRWAWHIATGGRDMALLARGVTHKMPFSCTPRLSGLLAVGFCALSVGAQAQRVLSLLAEALQLETRLGFLVPSAWGLGWRGCRHGLPHGEEFKFSLLHMG